MTNSPEPDDRCGWLAVVVPLMYALWIPAMRVLACVHALVCGR